MTTEESTLNKDIPGGPHTDESISQHPDPLVRQAWSIIQAWIRRGVSNKYEWALLLGMDLGKVITAEREACAHECEDYQKEMESEGSLRQAEIAKNCAALIRARSQSKGD